MLTHTGLKVSPADVESEQSPGAESAGIGASLGAAVSDAYALLYHAVSNGKEVPQGVRGPIINVRATLADDKPIGPDSESAFLDAYAKLAVLVAPATAETLRATSVGRPRWWAALLRLGPVTDAQRFAWGFGLLAVCLVGVVGVAEWTRTYITTVTATRKLFNANSRELLSTNAAMESVDEQIKVLRDRLGGPDGQGSAAAVDILHRQRNELRDRRERLFSENKDLLNSLDAGYRSLNRVILIARREELPDIITAVGNSMTGYLLPVLYGALGTCAFILRSLYAQMLDRSFDPRRSGEFVVRLFLGMLSGVTVQWVFTRDSPGMPDGATPLVLAFLAGYSVELLFTGMDRLLAAVTGRIRPAHASSRAGRPGVPQNGMPAIAKPEPLAPRAIS